ncbi:sensor histidine kinase [Nitratifractor sp.]
MFPSERRSLRRFLAIYLGSTLLLIGVGAALFYTYSLHRIYDTQYETLKYRIQAIREPLKTLHERFEGPMIYPHLPGICTSLYDIGGRYLVGEMAPRPLPKEEMWREGERLYYRYRMEPPYYLGAATVLASTPLDRGPIIQLRWQLGLALGLAALFIVLIARWLGSLFLAPVRETIGMLDRFIKDSAHELNTPVSTVLNNVELFKRAHPELAEAPEIRRIEGASRRLSRIYDDLAYLQLGHRRHRRIETLDLSALLEERLEYFGRQMELKRLGLERQIAPGVTLEADREDCSRIVDNLLSNAVKYTPAQGRIRVRLEEGLLEIADTGVGMDEQTRRRVGERFFRREQSEGGFGLGMSIVQGIAADYGWSFEIESEEGKGTKVRIRWAK